MWASRDCKQVWSPPALSSIPCRAQALPATQHELRSQQAPSKAEKPPIWFQLKETILKTIQFQFQARQFPAPRFRKLLSKHCWSLAAAQDLFRLRTLIKLLLIFRFSSYDFTLQALLTLCLGTSKLFADQSN